MEKEFHRGRTFQFPVHISVPIHVQIVADDFPFVHSISSIQSSQGQRTAGHKPEQRPEKEPLAEYRQARAEWQDWQLSSSGTNSLSVYISCCPKARVWQMTTDKQIVLLVSAHSDPQCDFSCIYCLQRMQHINIPR